MQTPLDHPSPERPFRLYVALTNHCNRACPWCSTCSSPAGSTFLTIDDYLRAIPEEGTFEMQLEGGEPTTHPQFWTLLECARVHPRCTRVVLCTNGVLIPRTRDRLLPWLERLGRPLTLKLSINHHLLERDAGLISLACALRDALPTGDASRLLVINVRLRQGTDQDDRAVLEAVTAAGLLSHSNVFFLQRYGFAHHETQWELPFLAGTHFALVNPDGVVFGPDLIGRSDAMGRLP